MSVNVNTSINPSLEGAEAEWAEAALDGGSSATGRWEACQMSRAQQRTIFTIGLRRGQGMLPLPGFRVGTAVWCHAQVVQEHHVITPSQYWSRREDGAWTYKSCTGNTMATVWPDGEFTGRTMSAIARVAGDETWHKGDGIPVEIGLVTSENVLGAAYEAYDDAKAAHQAAYAAYAEGSVTFSAICEASDRVRTIATFAMAMGADEWEDWAG